MTEAPADNDNGEATTAKPRKIPRRVVIVVSVVLLLFLVVVPGAVTCYTAAPRHARPPVIEFGGGQVHLPEPTSPDLTLTPGDHHGLRVMSLNLAHGRADGLHQLLTSKEAIRRNLGFAADVVRREQPTVVACQEADAPSVWSGRFNHVIYLTDKSGLRFAVHGVHVRGPGLQYGTAMITGLPVTDALAVTFKPSPPTFAKGATVTAVHWPGRPELAVDVVSVHLDFSRPSVRKRQVDALAAALRTRGRPLIVIGDFNCTWQASESVVATFAEQTGTHVYRPEATDLATFPALNKRLDWVLISSEFEFVTYRVLTDVVSDHWPVVCDIRLRTNSAIDSRQPEPRNR